MTIHGTCVCFGLAGAQFKLSRTDGVLLLGESGAGKSEVALRLIAMGARLVADDRTDLFLEKGKLFGRAPKTISGLLEIRGVGILNMPSAPRARIIVAVNLLGTEEPPRLPSRQYYKPAMPGLIRAAPIPLFSMSAGISAPEKILAAAAGVSHTLFRD